MIRKLKNVTKELTETFGTAPIRSLTSDDLTTVMKGVQYAKQKLDSIKLILW